MWTPQRFRSACAAAQFDQSLLLSLLWVAKDQNLIHVYSKKLMCRLIWVFAEHQYHFLDFAVFGSNGIFWKAIWAIAWQNQQNDLCTPRRLRSDLASTQSDQTSLCAQWVVKDPSFLHADSKDADQSLLGSPVILLVLSCCGSYSTISR